MKAMILEKEQARKLRVKGIKLNDIAVILKTSKQNVSAWTSDIKLSDEQKIAIKSKTNKHKYIIKTFTNEDAISYYLLGAFMTDGNVYKRKNTAITKIITLTSKDNDWLEKINQFICPNKPILKHNNCYRLAYYSTELANWLISKGCTPRKSLTLQFPIIPNEYILDFIRGCWDGDGSLSFTKSGTKGKNYQRQANLTSGSLSFCDGLSQTLNQLGINCKIYEHGRKERMIEGRMLKPSECYRVVLSSGKNVYNLVKLLYPIGTQLYMPRKYDIAQKIITDWEMPTLCMSCKSVLINPGNNAIYCKPCYKTRVNARQREAYRIKHPA